MTLIIILICIALQVFLTVRKVSPFLSLLLVAILAGLLLGMEPAVLLKSIEKGVGSTLAGLVWIIFLGAGLGKILEVSGAAEQISATLIRKFGTQNVQWAVLLTGFMIGIPLYYNAGFVILVPLIFSLARRTGLSILYVALPMAAALSTTHCFLPPHPGPVVLVNAFGADMGKTLIYGLMAAVPAVIVAGPVLGRLLKHIDVKDNPLFGQTDKSVFTKLPAAGPSFLIALLPVILISFGVLADRFLAEGDTLRTVFLFTGNSTIALLLSVLAALYYFGVRNGVEMGTQMKWLSDSVSGIAVIVLIITAGGVFKQVLEDSGTGAYIASFSEDLNMPPLVFAWVITALLRVTIGSATVAGLTAAGIVSPLLATGVSPELLALSVGAGSVFGSHINDSGFWMFKEFFNLNLKQTFMSWSLMEIIISVMGLLMILVLNTLI
jgi:Gnt-I system high-affinity gluconate transporter